MSKLSLNQSLFYTSGIAGSLLAIKVYSDQVFKKDISGDKNKEPGDNNKNMVRKDSEKDTSGDTSKCGTSPEAKNTPLEDFMDNIKIIHSDIDSLKESSAKAISNAEKIIDYKNELKNDLASSQSQLDQAVAQSKKDSYAKTQAETELGDTKDKLKLVEAKLNKTLSEFELFKVQSETHVQEKTQAEDKVAEIQSKLNQAEAKMTKIQSQFDKTKDIIRKNSEVYTGINLLIQNNEIPVSDELKAKFKNFMSSFNFNIDEIVKE